MAERGLIFTGESVRGIQAGTKTQTRRLVGLDTLQVSPTQGYDLTFRGQAPVRSIAQQRRGPRGCWQDMRMARFLELCPYGKPGDRLWVKETWAHDAPDLHDLRVEVEDVCGSSHGPYYRADGTHENSGLTWRNSMFMPRWVSRITLEVTSMRVERLQSISTMDAMAEGVAPRPVAGGAMSYTHGYRVAWDAINGKRSPWDRNDWVWVIGFERVEQSAGKAS